MTSTLSNLQPTHKSLCGTRLDNAISIHHLLPGYDLPTSCFNDVVLVPLASWLFYLFLIGAGVVVAVFASRSSTGSGVLRTLTTKQQQPMRVYYPRGQKKKWAGLRLTGEIIYTLLIIAAILMNILEQVRLSIFKPNTRGVGLLPFIYPSILLVLFLSHWPRTNTILFRACILLFWLLLLIFTAVKLRVLAVLGNYESRDGTEYLSSDQQLDVGVMVGLYGIFVIVETFALVKVLRHRGTGTSAEDDGLVKNTKDESA